MDIDRGSLLVVLLVAALAPVLADLPARVRVPSVVAEIVLGIVVGPQVLGLAHADSLLVFAVVAIGAGVLAVRMRPERIVRLVGATMHASGQLALRLAVLLIGALVVLAGTLGLDIVLGALASGLIVGMIARGEAAHDFHVKLDGVGYGFLIPIFFIVTGLEFDLDALLSSASSIVLVPGFALLFLLVRGLPAMVLYRGDLELGERRALALMSAAALPLIVAITEVAVEVGNLSEQDAVALVGAGMVSMLVYPLVATAIIPQES